MEINKENKEIVNILQELLQKNYDAEAGYKQVMTKAKSMGLKEWLQAKARQRSEFATQLDVMIREYNATPADEGTILGTMHRAWIDFKTTLSADTDKALLEECIRGEEASVTEYENQLENVADYLPIKELLFAQMTSVKTALNAVERLEDIIG
ncbi:PA2169 family four-helix-bundle protein [Mariniflexile ostreae]|uniref:PA2169 family four-helix-bundle protein n=1 Tax=Mariniflexile ostreae TaxID=1520892 RepID=A0ABV5FD98_9FLAO